MAFVGLLQSAPERNGSVEAPSSWSGGTSTSTPASNGVYRGSESATYTFTAPSTTETVGSGSWLLAWANDLGDSGVLPLGSTYTADDELQVHDGVTMSFGAGGMGGSETFTVDVKAANRLPGGHQQVVANATPAAITPNLSSKSVDEIVRTRLNVIHRQPRAIARDPKIAIDYMTPTEYQAYLLMQQQRQEVTLYEDYSKDTVLLWRAIGGRSNLPMIGEEITPNRSGSVTYRDPSSGLYRSVGTNVSAPAEGLVGDALLVNQSAVINACPRFHATSATAAWATSTGSPTITFDTLVLPPLDPDDSYWNSGVLEGTQRISFPDLSGVATENAAVGAAQTWTAHVLLKGQGKITLQLRSGAGSPNNIIASEEYDIDSNDWQIYRVTGTTGAGHNTMDLELKANDGPALLWASCVQIELGSLVSSYIQGAAFPTSSVGVVQADSFLFNLQLPRPGTIGFWWYQPENTETTGFFSLWEAFSSNFAIRYNIGTGKLEFHTDSTGDLESSVLNLAEGAWHHIAVCWEHSDTVDGELQRKIFHNGLEVGSDSTSDWEDDWGTVHGFTIPGSGSTNGRGFRFAECRVDGKCQPVSEIKTWYDRFTTDEWASAHLVYSGRRFQILSTQDSWLDVSSPNRIISTASMAEASIDADAVIISR